MGNGEEGGEMLCYVWHTFWIHELKAAEVSKMGLGNTLTVICQSWMW